MNRHRLHSDADSRSDVWRGDSLLTKLLLAYCRRLPDFRGKGTIFQHLAASAFGGRLHVHNLQGVRLTINPADYLGRTIAFEGSVERASLALARTILASGGVFVDVGCNFGLYTLMVGSLPGVHCIALDGSFVALTQFEINLRRNPRVQATVVNCALASEPGLHCFELPSARNLGGMRITENPGAHGRFWAAGTRLKDVLSTLGPSGVKLLKIDVEGFELSVFQGFDFQSACRPEHLIVECYVDLFPDATKAILYLIDQGYEALTIDGEPVRDFRDLPENNVWCRDVRERSSRT